MSKRLDTLMHVLDDAVAALESTANPVNGRVPPADLTCGDGVITATGERRVVRSIERVTGAVRVNFDCGPGVVVPSSLTVRVHR